MKKAIELFKLNYEGDFQQRFVLINRNKRDKFERDLKEAVRIANENNLNMYGVSQEPIYSSEIVEFVLDILIDKGYEQIHVDINTDYYTHLTEFYRFPDYHDQPARNLLFEIEHVRKGQETKVLEEENE